MEVLKELINYYSNGKLVNKIHYSLKAVLVDTGNCGVSSIYQKPNSIEKYLNKPVKNILDLCFSDNYFETGIGLATLNSLIKVNENKVIKENGKNLLIEKGRNKNVAVIGHFPFVEKMGKEFKQFHVFDKKPILNDLPEDKIPELLPEAEVVAITGSTLVNHSFENVMKHISKNAFVIMLGPSTPNSEILFDYGIDVICGSIVIDKEAATNDLVENKPFRKIKGLIGITLVKDKL